MAVLISKKLKEIWIYIWSISRHLQVDPYKSESWNIHKIF